ncbi:ABC transporter permease [Bradyrhizobium sp. CCBAU 45384]|uniref:ABC transporter permease n=1 Tax=Bradyrhizobium sp. CCBAU 45384 TaxID=858428 RepID=UPI002304F27B|nr:ABC transporter permease [Bradyrhizobium sp. CCBAU 45384]
MSMPALSTHDASEITSADAAAQAGFAAAARLAAWRRRLLPLAAVIALLILWELGVMIFKIRPFIAPAPTAVAMTLYGKFGMLLGNLLPTAIEAVAGFLIGNSAAILLATAFVYQRTAEEALFPIAVMFHTIPVMAYAPILVLLLGNGLEAKVAIAALICFFPTLVNMTRGLRSVSSQQMELMRILSATPSEIFFKLRLKSSLPYLFSALKIASATSVIGAIVGEWIGATTGIGALIIQATYNFDSPLLYATIVVGSAFSAAFFGAISWLERHFLKWNVAQTA